MLKNNTGFEKTVLIHNAQIWYNWGVLNHWSGVRVVEGGGLENRCAARHRGFESPLLRTVAACSESTTVAE